MLLETGESAAAYVARVLTERMPDVPAAKLAAFGEALEDFVKEAVTQEREACAALCDAAHNDDRHGLDACDLAGHLAGMIRLRAEKR